jgi:uncharacterized membrane protein YuzA (DUF378 family)
MNINNFEFNANIYFILKIIVIIGALNWGLVAIDKKFNAIELFSSLFGKYYGYIVEKIIYIIITLATIYVMLQRKTYLPFLDATVVPVNRFLSESKQKDFELEIVIDAKDGEKVIYWASNKKEINDKTINKWDKAYDNYDNSGISLVDANGKAKIYVKCPQEYYVKFGKVIPKHVHYRIITKGILGEVKTINLSC